MKTKEEIGELAKGNDRRGYERNCFIDGYTQCQEDNKEKKYTEEDLRKAISEAQKKWIGFPIHNSLEDAEVNFVYNADEIINSLNKQD
jgi:hypothetical protein